MLGWMKLKIAGRNINNLRYVDDTTLKTESEQQLKRLLVVVKEDSEKAGLKLNICKTKIMTSGPMPSLQVDKEKKMETVTVFIFLSSKITVNNDYSHEIKRPSLEEKLDSVLKSRDITLPTKIHLVKAMVFPAVMYRCESWTIKKTESWRMMLSNCCAIEDSWESVPWTAGRSN